MQLPPSLTPCQRLQQAWTELNAATAPETKKQKQVEMIALLKDQILGFSGHDADKLREIANSMKLNQVDPELSERVAELANNLTGFSLGRLPDELMLHSLSFVPLMNRFGIHCSERMWAAESRRPAYLAPFVNNPDHPIPLDHLPILLAKCGGSVLHLDFSRLLTPGDRQRMTGDQLAALVNLCPSLQSLTLYEVDQINAEQLLGIVNQVPGLTNLNVARCLKMFDQESLQALQASRPQLPIGFVSYSDTDLARLLHRGVKLRPYLALSAPLRAYIASNISEIQDLLFKEFPFELFCQISDEKRALFVANSSHINLLKSVKNFSFSTLARLSTQELALILDRSNSDNVIRLGANGLHFAQFCELPHHTKQMLLHLPINRAVANLLRCKVTLDQFLALSSTIREQLTEKPDSASKLLELGFTWEQLINLRWDTRQEIYEHAFDCSCLVKKGIPVQTFAQLELPLLQLVLRKQLTVGMLLDAGMNFDAFCALPETVRQRVMKQSSPLGVLLRRGDSLQTLLRLTDEELTYIFNNMKGFSGISTIQIPAFMKNMPMFKVMREKADSEGKVRNLSPDACGPEAVQSQGMSIVNDVMGAAFNMVSLSEEERTLQMQTETLTLINGGIPLSRFVELQGALRQRVLQHSDAIGAKIVAGMDFEAFLQLPESEQDKILNA